jgi:ribosomal-protein-alanine N-acetyltransferase
MIGHSHPDRSLVRVISEEYLIRDLRIDDAAAMAAAYDRNRDHLARWDPRRDVNFFTEAGQAEVVAQQLAAKEVGMVVPWVVVHGDDIVGRVNLNNVVRGVMCSASVGYWVDLHHLRRGLATAAVEHACEQAALLGLHRLEAGTMPENVASQRVLERCGFSEYGLARQYLFIDGAWQDHRLFQRILHDRPL